MEEAVKRGRGRPPGSCNRPRADDLGPEERDALAKRLAQDYAIAIAAEAVAKDRRRRATGAIRANFGVHGFNVLDDLIARAQDQLLPASPQHEALS